MAIMERETVKASVEKSPQVSAGKSPVSAPYAEFDDLKVPVAELGDAWGLRVTFAKPTCPNHAPQPTP